MSDSKTYKFIVGFVSAVATSCLSAAMFAAFWNWFLVRQFGLVPVTWVSAYGFQMVFGFLMVPVISAIALANQSEDDKNKPLAQNLAKAIVYCVVFVVGWVFHVLVGH